MMLFGLSALYAIYALDLIATLTHEQLSLGLEFVHQVMHASSYDEKLNILESHGSRRSSSPYDRLTFENDEHVEDHDDEYLDDSFDEDPAKYDPRKPTLIDRDLDRGPKEAWQQAYYSLP